MENLRPSLENLDLNQFPFEKKLVFDSELIEELPLEDESPTKNEINPSNVTNFRPNTTNYTKVSKKLKTKRLLDAKAYNQTFREHVVQKAR